MQFVKGLLKKSVLHLTLKLKVDWLEIIINNNVKKYWVIISNIKSIFLENIKYAWYAYKNQEICTFFIKVEICKIWIFNF